MKSELVSQISATSPPASMRKVINTDTTAAPKENQQVSTTNDNTRAAATKAEQATTDPVALDKAVSDLNSYMRQQNRSLQFSVDQDSGRTVVKVIDQHDDEVIRQYPSEEVLALAKLLKADERGVLFKARV